MSAEYKNLALTLEGLQVKAADDGVGTFTGYASIFGNKDLQGDVIQPGAFRRSLDRARKERGGQFPLLWQHDQSEPIGSFEAVEDERGLKISGRLCLEIEKAKNALALMRAKILSGLSIGYRVIKDELTKGGRLLKEVELWETSLVTFPANPLARVLVAKSNGSIVGAVPTRFKTDDDDLDSALADEIAAEDSFFGGGAFDWESAEKSQEKRALDDLLANGKKLLGDLRDENEKLRYSATEERAAGELLAPMARELSRELNNLRMEDEVHFTARNSVRVPQEKAELARRAAKLASEILGMDSPPEIFFYRPDTHPGCAGWTSRTAQRKGRIFISEKLEGDELVEVAAHETYHNAQLELDSAGMFTAEELEPYALDFGRRFRALYGGEK